eukprot:GHVU01189986.1.p1 GENE.GHVU01189986.1~~GHVU01189986.1.p1  ORF type:complete len:255 (+),score=24.89 GHVU01189986.1:229-993(+)
MSGTSHVIENFHIGDGLQHYRISFHNGNTFVGRHKLSNSLGLMEEPIRNGWGTMTYSRGGSYEGAWKDGAPHGRGKKVYSNGDVYDGSFSDGLPNGQGIAKGKDGSEFIGTWKNGTFEKGMWKGSDGRTHKVHVQGGNMEMVCAEGNRLGLTWVNGILDGPIEVVDVETGSVLRGTVKKGNLEDAHVQDPMRPEYGIRPIIRPVSSRHIHPDQLSDLITDLVAECRQKPMEVLTNGSGSVQARSIYGLASSEAD